MPEHCSKDRGYGIIEESVGEILSSAGGDGLLSFAEAYGLSADTETLLLRSDGTAVLRILSDALSEAGNRIPLLCGTILAILLIATGIRRYAENAGGVGDTVSLCISAVLAYPVWNTFLQLTETADVFFSQIHAAVSSAAVTLSALTAMRGYLLTASVSQAGLVFFLTVCESVVNGWLFPLLRVTAVTSLASVFSDTVDLSGIGGFLAKTFLTCVGFLMMLLCTVLSLQSVLARGADSVSLRSVRFALGASVPIVGNAVGEAAATLAGGLSLASKTGGLLAILSVIYTMLPPLFSVFLSKSVFGLGASAAGMLFLDREKRILDSAEHITGFLCAAMAAETILLLLCLAVCTMGGG